MPMYLFVALSLLSGCFLQSVAESPYQLNVKDDDSFSENQMCPPYFFCEEEHCKCSRNLPNDIIACGDEKHQFWISIVLLVYV